MIRLHALVIAFGFVSFFSVQSGSAQDRKVKDARNTKTGNADPFEDPEFAKYAIYAATAPRAETTVPKPTGLPLRMAPKTRIAFIGNMLLERSQHFGYLETLLQQHYPDHELTVRNLGWPADTATLQPRPDNFADTEQHLFHERADVILVAFGFNESFRGGGGLLGFTAATGNYIAKLQSLAFNGKGSPRIVVLSPIANEDIEGVKASKNNPSIKMYADALQTLAEDLQVGYVDLFEPTARAMKSPGNDLTINGVHLNDAGYQFVSDIIFRTLTAEDPPAPREDIRRVVIDKNRQYFRRFRPLNTFITPVGGARRTATWTFFRR